MGYSRLKGVTVPLPCTTDGYCRLKVATAECSSGYSRLLQTISGYNGLFADKESGFHVSATIPQAPFLEADLISCAHHGKTKPGHEPCSYICTKERSVLLLESQKLSRFKVRVHHFCPFFVCFFFVVFCVPQLYLWGSPLLG